MNILNNKLKKASKFMRFIFFITIVGYIISYVIFASNILKLTGIETFIRMILLIFFILFGLTYLFFGLAQIIKKNKVKFTILTIITIIFIGLFSFSSYFINKIYSKLSNISVKEKSIYTTALVSLNDTVMTSDSKVGMIEDENDKTGNILPKEMMKKENLTYTIKYYNNYTELLEALRDGKVDAIFITKDYKVIYGNEEAFTDFLSNTTIIKEYSKEMKNDESKFLTSTKSLTEPFTVLVLGVDSEDDTLDANAPYNGDTIMLVTFNPKTLSATMFSVPRDLYIPIYNAYNRQVGYNKVNSSAAYGTASTINTVKNLTGIDIDYFVKVNFNGVIDLVNAVGGIDVDVEAPTYDAYVYTWGKGVLCESDANRTYINTVCMEVGMQHLNGEQALAYARNRHGYLAGDIARNKHQQQIIEALARKVLSTSSLADFERLLDTISNNIATNMNTEQILSFYNSIKGMLTRALNKEDFITINKSELTYFSFENQYGLSCLGYYKGSLEAITNAMKENLGLKDIEVIKTFTYDYSDDYNLSSTIIGKGIISGGKVPDSSITNPKIITTNDDEKTTEEKKEKSKKDNDSKTNTTTDKSNNTNTSNNSNNNSNSNSNSNTNNSTSNQEDNTTTTTNNNNSNTTSNTKSSTNNDDNITENNNNSNSNKENSSTTPSTNNDSVTTSKEPTTDKE